MSFHTGPHCSRMEVKERQRLLLEQYYFHCNCQACQRDLIEGRQNATENAAPGLKCVKCGKPFLVNFSEKLKLSFSWFIVCILMYAVHFSPIWMGTCALGCRVVIRSPVLMCRTN